MGGSGESPEWPCSGLDCLHFPFPNMGVALQLFLKFLCSPNATSTVWNFFISRASQLQETVCRHPTRSSLQFWKAWEVGRKCAASRVCDRRPTHTLHGRRVVLCGKFSSQGRSQRKFVIGRKSRAWIYTILKQTHHAIVMLWMGSAPSWKQYHKFSSINDDFFLPVMWSLSWPYICETLGLISSISCPTSPLIK